MRIFSRPDPTPRFIPELESIRGIAAISVAITHALIAFKYAQTDAVWLTAPWAVSNAELTWVSFLLILFNGAAAVTVFFVLSGIVLGLALDARHERFMVVWGEFVVARIARIYPSVIAVLAFVVGYLSFFHHDQAFANASAWYGWWYHGELSLGLILKNMLLLDQSLNPVAWTLAVEVVVAMMFPVLFRYSRRVNGLFNCGIVLALMLLAFYYPDNLLCAHLYKFYLGLLLPLFAGSAFITRLYQAIPLLLALVLLLAARAIWGFDNPLAMMAETLGATLLLASLCAGMPLHPLARKILRAHWVRWAGRISYSFYLWHFIVLYVLTRIMLYSMPAAQLQAHTLGCALGLAAVSIAVTGFLASLMYRLVERRGMGLGKWVLAALRSKSERETAGRR